MSAYIVIVEDGEVAFEEERSRLIAWIEQHGGTYLARGAPAHIIEGDVEAQRVFLVETETVEAAKAAFETEEYAAVRAARKKAGIFVTVLIVEKLPGA